jgi:hypothetical protein
LMVKSIITMTNFNTNVRNNLDIFGGTYQRSYMCEYSNFHILFGDNIFPV